MIAGSDLAREGEGGRIKKAMPVRNRIKQYTTDLYYHVYNRGMNGQDIFRDDMDYDYFIMLFKRYLGDKSEAGVRQKDNFGRPYDKLDDEVELIAYNLAPNHFHLLFLLKAPQGIVHVMRSVMTAYTMYFNAKYDRTGSLCQGVFLARPITVEIYLWHVARHLHLDPSGSYSSLQYIQDGRRTSWLHDERIAGTSEERQQYLDFVKTYAYDENEHELLKNLLAAE